MQPTAETLFQRVADSSPLANKFRRVLAGDSRVVFDHVAPSAQPFLATALIRSLPASNARVWIVCETEREQERFHGELTTWLSEAAFFPSAEVAMVAGALPDPEVAAERLDILQKLGGDAALILVVHEKSLDEIVSSPKSIEKLTLTLEPGKEADREALIGRLAAAGYEHVPQITDRGQFAVRGGIMDIYSWQHALPNRLEWSGDEVESIREFSLDQQVSVRSLERCLLLLGEPEGGSKKLRDYRKKGDLVVLIDDVSEEGRVRITAQPANGAEGVEDHDGAFYDSPLAPSRRQAQVAGVDGEAATRHVIRELKSWREDGFSLTVNYWKDRELTACKALLEHAGWSEGQVLYRQSESQAGFVFPLGKLVVVPAVELLGGVAAAGASKRVIAPPRILARGARAPLDFTTLHDGDLVIHLEHGLARFRGVEHRRIENMTRAEEGPALEEVLVLEFADDAKLYVPLEQAAQISRYLGLGRRNVALSRLGDGKWNATKRAAEKSIFDYAAQLLKIQATREARPGVPFQPDGPWQGAFEETFPYRETADQVTAIAATKTDMETARPMDRLICGDVGFGKTEVALRAAFKAAADGRQVAMMVPTTVLAQQHFDNFRERMANFPLSVELLSRYRSPAEQKRVAAGLHAGGVDIVIGTHRLISRDIEFKDLGLLIVDEEQRFGVKHKERMKERFPGVDVLTLSATPIPRTLYMALTGARDLSTLETPPPNRYPIETVICGYDERVIRAAIDRELERGGQVYFLHNRIETIERVRTRILALCPKARVDLGHGRMDEEQLEAVMHRFVTGQTDVLVATTIIESGLDIPNANTIIIDRADRFGLADLYQLRGRVGRGQHKAYAYLLLPRELLGTGEARKRINAIKQYSSLGAGFKIALRDLELRGAGNILGVAQSGHLTAVGFDLYCQLLRQAVARLRGERVKTRVEVEVRLDFAALTEAEFARRGGADELWPAFLPAAYMEDSTLRIQAYRQLASLAGPGEADKLRATWRDRFGPLPPAAENLLTLARLKLTAAKARVQQVEVRQDRVMLTRGGELVLLEGKFPRLKAADSGAKVREVGRLLAEL